MLSNFSVGQYVSLDGCPGSVGYIRRIQQSLNAPEYATIQLLTPFHPDHERNTRVRLDIREITALPSPIYCPAEHQRQILAYMRTIARESENLRKASRGEGYDWDIAVAKDSVRMLRQLILNIEKLLPHDTPYTYRESLQRAEKLAMRLFTGIFESILGSLPPNINRTRSQFRCHLRDALRKTDAGLWLGDLITVIKLSGDTEIPD